MKWVPINSCRLVLLVVAVVGGVAVGRSVLGVRGVWEKGGGVGD